MIANVTVGAVLYTSYLQALGTLYVPASQGAKRVHPPAALHTTFMAGCLAGTMQSIVAAPLDALQIRFHKNDMLEGKHGTMWSYARAKLQEIGIRGVCAGWTLSFVKDSLGYGAFFATFEYVKSQAYYDFARAYYGSYKPMFEYHPYKSTMRVENETPTIRPHYAMEPTFILLAGVAATVAQQLIQYPLNEIQDVHYGRLESLDYQAKLEPPKRKMLWLYYRAYEQTYLQCSTQAKRVGGWRCWLYKGFLGNTIRQIPSTSAGLVVFEVIRRKYGIDTEEVVIERDGYQILLS